MRKSTKQALAGARVEKDVENAYRAEISHVRPNAAWTSPFGSDGVAEWGAPSVRLLLEAKYDQDLKAKAPVCNVLGQMLGYLKRFEQAGEVLPDVLLVGDKNECFVLATASVRGFLDLDIDWTFAPSKGSPELTRALVQGVNLLPYVYDVDENLDFRAVVEKVETLANGSRHQVRATSTNLGAIFLYWRDRVFGSQGLTPVEQVDVFLRCLFQPGDVYIHPTKRGVLVVPGYDDGVLVNAEQYRSFFDHFAQGYKPSEIESFYGMKDRLVEDDARRRQGAFFTPALWVAEAHKELDRVLGPRWRQECVVWDPAAGTANLTRDYNDWGCLVSSTAERPDVQVMKDQGWGGQVFQYDFLNPGSESPFFTPEDGKNVIPDSVDRMLRAAARAGKRLVFFMNPPYGTAAAGHGQGANKVGSTSTAMNESMSRQKLGLSRQQLYAQFMFRCVGVAQEYGFRYSTVGIFCKPTFMSSGAYKPLRDWWYSHHAYAGGFLFQASHFADVSGAWGISFTAWNSGGRTDKAATLPITLKDEADFTVISGGHKGVYNSDDRNAFEWVFGSDKGATTPQAPVQRSGLSIRDDEGRYGRWHGQTLCTAVFDGNSPFKNGEGVYLLSSQASTRSGPIPVARDNWRRSVALYGARKLVQGNWINDKDEYLRPDEKAAGYEQWVDDCHVYALLHNSNNCTAMRDVDYKGKKWRIKNHWFWRTRKDALKALDTRETPALYRDCKQEPVKAPDNDDVLGLNTVEPWEQTGDAYFAHCLWHSPTLNLSPDARKVLDLLDALWVKSLPVRESYAAGKPELHLMAYDAGVYQLKHLWRDLFPNEWKALQEAFKALSLRLQPGVYDYGFLRR